MTRIARLSQAKGSKKVDNNPTALAAKVKIRQNVIETIGRKAAVFDAFAGSGEMYSAVWKTAGAYAGCDMKRQRDDRLMFCADNRRVLRAIDLSKFSIFDLDAYGFPWEAAIIISDRRRVAPGERIGMVFTEAGGISSRQNTVPIAITLLTGVRNRSVGLGRMRAQIFDRALLGLTSRMNCTIERRWQAMASRSSTGGPGGMQTIYCGVVLKGKG